MTINELKHRLRTAGYSLRLVWQAQETAARRSDLPTVECYSVYRQSDGHLLTSLVFREMRMRDDSDVFTFWISEGARVDDDIAYLRSLEARLAGEAA